MAEGRDPPGPLHQDRIRDSRRLPGGHGGRKAQPRDVAPLRGTAAIVEAYLIYWAVVYLSRASGSASAANGRRRSPGISICGVAASIATGGAIRARPVVPVMVSSLVVIFAVVEVLILPFLAQTFLSHEPLVAAAWMGLAIKTDGAVVAGRRHHRGAHSRQVRRRGQSAISRWILGTTATVKVFIDIFIGIWAFILGYIWTNHQPDARRRQGEGGRDLAALPQVHHRLPGDLRARSPLAAARRRSP